MDQTNGAPASRTLSIDLVDLNAPPVLSDEYYNVDDFFTTYITELTQRNKRPLDTASNGTNGNQSAPKLPRQDDFIVPPNFPTPPELLDPPSTAPVDPVFQFNPDAPAIGNSRFKTVKQQEANKVAQQRYRERKKQKYVEMEQTVAQLQGQLRALQALQQRNEILENMNTDLQGQLIGKEREIDRLKIVLDTQADASIEMSRGDSQTNLSSEGDSQGCETKVPTSCCGPKANTASANPGVRCDLLPQDLTGINFQTGFEDQITALKAFMTQLELFDKNPHDPNLLTQEQVSELSLLVGRSCQLCQAAIRAEGAKVLDLIVKSPAEISQTGQDQDCWSNALTAIHMTPEQQEQLLLLRKSHLEKVKSIYAERQALNLDAMALMLPQYGDRRHDTTVEGRLEAISTRGYMDTAKSNAHLAEVLDKIKDNLRREQRSIMDLNCCTVQQILTPLQAAKYMVAVYPRHCDALALSNALASLLGR